MDNGSGRYFVGPGNKRVLELGTDGKTFIQIHSDGVIQGGVGAEFNGISLMQASLETCDLDSCTLETPTLQSAIFDSSPSGDHVDCWKEVAITKANILAMNGTPVTVVASPGAGKVLQFLDACLIFDYAGNTYGGGGDVTINYEGGSAVSTTVAKGNAFGAAGDKVYWMPALNAAGGYSMYVNSALQITNATGAFTDPGGPAATGVGRLKIHYRVITTGL